MIMMPPVFPSLLLVLSAALLSASLCAEDEKPSDPDLPQPLNLQVAQPLLESSPFTRALNLADSLTLTGIAYVEGKPVATIADKATKQTYMVSGEPNAQGWRLTETTPSSQPRRTQVKLMVGTEEVIVRYNDAQLAPTSRGGGKFPTEQEYTGHDENGKPYIKGSAYLSDEDRDRYHNALSREAHDKFRDIIRANRDKMLSSSPEERAAYAKQVLDKVAAEDKGSPRK